VSRRAFLALTAGSAALLAACRSQPPGSVADDGSVTVTHVFGQTRIPKAPTRVVSAGLNDADDLLAVGVVPVAVTDWFGGQPFGVWPWAQTKLGAAQPVVLSLADGVPVQQIAGLKPDLIVATNAGLDKATYDQLTAIAPTVAQTGQAAFFEPWRDQATVIGQAAFRRDEMTALIDDVGKKFGAVKDNNTQFAGKKALLLDGTLTAGAATVSGPAWRREFLTAMGLDAVDPGQAVIPPDRMASVLDGADVLIWTTESDEDQAALLADPTIAALRATARRRHVFTGKDLAGAIAYASTLSYPFVADQLPPRIAAALG
jgi:iron complex transport system substrate-binding protein